MEVNVTEQAGVQPVAGTAGLPTQVPGSPTTVDGAAVATGGIAPGNFIETDIDKELFAFQSEDTALMTLMGQAKKVAVNSKVVEHYQIDEQRATAVVKAAVVASNSQTAQLELDEAIVRPYHTLMVRGVDGYKEDGKTVTPGKSLMLFVTGLNDATQMPIVRAINGPKARVEDSYCTVPAIPEGTEVMVMANALYETQKEVDPNLILPHPTTQYLQKRGMNHVVSDYFKSQKMRVPFTEATIAEAAILEFKRQGNRTLWCGVKGKLTVNVPKLGVQEIYMTEGLRYQFKREIKHRGAWTYEQLISMCKLFFTGEDVPTSCILLAGKNLLESLQCIDYKNHPEVQIASAKNEATGWEVTRIVTVFGTIDIKREPTLDTIGWSNSGALIGENRLVHYVYSQQHEFADRIEGEEATRKGVIVWDGLCLKGGCHIWIDGEGETGASDASNIILWDKMEAPEGGEIVAGAKYYMSVNCPGIGDWAVIGSVAEYDSASGEWKPSGITLNIA